MASTNRGRLRYRNLWEVHTSMRVLIVGAGGHAQVIADCLLRMAEAGHVYNPMGYVDDNPALLNRCFVQLPVLGTLAQLETIPHDALILGIGDNTIRHRLFEQLHGQGHRFVSAIHPRATVAPDVTVGSGTLICAGAVVNTGTKLGQNVIINTGATVDHGNQIGDHVHVAPGVHLGGDVTVGNGTLIGIGATVMPQRNIGAWAVIGAASLVHATVADRTTVFGVPARIQHKPKHE